MASVLRIDNWSDEDELILVNEVLRNISECGTQEQAFLDAGRKIGRTSAACGFRWNKYLRYQYRHSYQIAMNMRVEAKSKRYQPVTSN